MIGFSTVPVLNECAPARSGEARYRFRSDSGSALVPARPAPSGERSEILDMVRGLAITMVVAFHYWQVPNGDRGVDLFFVLSGYLLGGILIDNRLRPRLFATFYGRRAFRILPLYVAFLALCLAVPQLDTFDAPLWTYITFTQNFGWIAQCHIAVVPTSVTWSLAVEEQFYLVAPILVVMTPPRKLPSVLWSLVILAPLVRYASEQICSIAPFLLLPGRLDSLMGGVLVAVWVRMPPEQRIALRWKWALLAFVPPAFDIILHLQTDVHAWAVSIVAAWCSGMVLAVTFVLPFRTVLLRPLRCAGLGAYSIYLFHWPALMLVGNTFLALLMTLIGAWASWVLIEAPLISWARQRWHYAGQEKTSPVLGFAGEASVRDR
jgi:peptidoglycan/LPS O-acetylase OafA/YrhL